METKTPKCEKFVSLISSFVKHMDNNEFESAKRYLADSVVYKFRGQVVLGADQVMGCYKNSYESVSGQIDEIVLESEVVELGNNKWRTNYTDILFKNGKKHIHRCYQELLWLNDKIVEIEHFDIDGEVALLNEFFENHGIVRKKF